MMWTKLDAKLRQNRKIKKALRRDPMAILLWLWVLVGIGHEQTDGYVSLEEIEDAAHEMFMDEDQAAACVAILMDVGLLHDRKGARKCEHCTDIAPKIDGYYVHDFADYNPTQDQALIPIEKLRWKRKKALHQDGALCEAIQARDGDRCCYCDHEVKWSDRRGDYGGTYDHLDPNCFEPNLGNAMELVVVACRLDNGRKGNRTPEEYHAAGGPKLLRDPRNSDQSRSRLGRDQIATRSDLPATRSHGRVTRETDRVGSEPGFNQIGNQIPAANGHGTNGHGMNGASQ